MEQLDSGRFGGGPSRKVDTEYICSKCGYPYPGQKKATAEKLRDLICKYWDAAYAEGQEGRDCDTPEGTAGRLWHEINKTINQLT